MPRLTLIAPTLALTAIAAPAHADELQTRLAAGARANDTAGFAFRETITLAGNGPGMGDGPKTFVSTYDPRRAPADRWRRVSVDGRAPTAKEAVQSRKTKRDSVPNYAEIAKWIASPATRVDGAGGTVTYRFARLPAGTVKLGKHDASADTAAEVQVAGGPAPYVTQVRFTLTKGFRMMLVASVKSMTATSRYRRGPEGRVVPADVTSTIAGSMMGRSGEIRTSVTYADWARVQ